MKPTPLLLLTAKCLFGAILTASPIPLSACVLNIHYLKLPLEERVAEASDIFIGHVEKVQCDKENGFRVVPQSFELGHTGLAPIGHPPCRSVVTISKDEILLGDKSPKLLIPQGQPSACQIPFYMNEIIFFSGRGLLSGTTDLKNGVPPELQEVLSKIRSGIPLRHRSR